MSDGSSVKPFNFEDSGRKWQVRFVGTAEDPEWVGADVVEVLYPAAIQNQNHSTYLSKVPIEWKGSKRVATPGGKQVVVTLFEPGLYCLIARSESWFVTLLSGDSRRHS